MIEPDFLSQLQRFSLIVNKRVTSKYSGERKSAYSGSGTIFKDRRIYATGDNFRAIDWRVYARTDDLYIKIFEEERNLDVHILIDSSKSMSYHDKYDYAGKIGLGLAFLGLKNNEQVHFSLFSTDVETFRGSKGSNQILQMLHNFNQSHPAGRTDMLMALKRYRPYIKSKSFIVIISDLMLDQENIIKALQTLNRNHKIKLIQVLDIEEKEMTLEGDFKMIDSESDSELRTYISKKTQQDYKERLNSHTTEIKSVCSELGIEFFQITTEQPLFDSFFELVRT